MVTTDGWVMVPREMGIPTFDIWSRDETDISEVKLIVDPLFSTTEVRALTLQVDGLRVELGQPGSIGWVPAKVIHGSHGLAWARTTGASSSPVAGYERDVGSARTLRLGGKDEKPEATIREVLSQPGFHHVTLSNDALNGTEISFDLRCYLLIRKRLGRLGEMREIVCGNRCDGYTFKCDPSVAVYRCSNRVVGKTAEGRTKE